jgi:TATA-box binding protein (TBP) (component of TFIID and TFIIIB)
MTGAFSEAIDLNAAHSKLDGSKCNWRRFPGLSFKPKLSPATFLLFRNGKFVCTGTKSEIRGKEATRTFLNILKEKSLVSTNCNFECSVKNLVTSVSINGASISMEQFTKQFEKVVYEPDKFPAAVYNMGKATFLVFLTGKLICSGVGDEDTLKRTVKIFCDQLAERNVLEAVA